MVTLLSYLELDVGIHHPLLLVKKLWCFLLVRLFGFSLNTSSSSLQKMSQIPPEPHMQQVDLTTLTMPQLTQLKQQLDQVLVKLNLTLP